MRIFLTGATGYIGSAVLDALQRGGHRVTALVRDPERAEQLAGRGIDPVIGELSRASAYAGAAEGADAESASRAGAPVRVEGAIGGGVARVGTGDGGEDGGTVVGRARQGAELVHGPG